MEKMNFSRKKTSPGYKTRRKHSAEEGLSVERKSGPPETEQTDPFETQCRMFPSNKDPKQSQSTSKRPRRTHQRRQESGMSVEDFSNPTKYQQYMSHLSNQPRRIYPDDSPVGSKKSEANGSSDSSNNQTTSDDEESYHTCSDSELDETASQPKSKFSSGSSHSSRLEYTKDDPKNSFADVSLPSEHLHSSMDRLFKAIMEDNESTVREIIASGAVHVNALIKGTTTPLMLAATVDSKIVTKLLLDNKASVDSTDKDGATPLFLASSNGNYEIVKLLVQAGANVNHKAKDIPMLLQPSRKGFSMIVQYLLENGAKPNITDKDGCSPLMAAAANGQRDVVTVLLIHGADVTMVNKKTGSTALQEAIDGEHTEVVVILMKATTEAKKKSDRLFTCKTSEEVRQLLKHGGKVDERRGDGTTPLMVQSQDDNVEVVQELIQHGANVDLQDDVGETALMKASKEGNFCIVQKLVNSRAILDLKTKEGETALMLTTRRNNVLIVKELLLAGADPATRNKNGQSVQDIAKDQGSDDIIEALRKHTTITNKSNPFVQALSTFLQDKEDKQSSSPPTSRKPRRPLSAKASAPIRKSTVSTGKSKLTPSVAKSNTQDDEDESTMKSEMEKAWRRVADLETRVHELTLKTTMELTNQEDLSYLERGRLEAEFRKLKELKKKAESYSIEAKQTAQRLSAENFKLKEQMNQLRHLSDITEQNLKREKKKEVERAKAFTKLAEPDTQKVFKDAVIAQAYELLGKMNKPTWTLAQHATASFELKPETVRDIILHHTVRACFVQVVVGGLPYSGKSTLVQNMLPQQNQEAAKLEQLHGLGIYEAIMMNDMVDDRSLGNWVPFVKDSVELLSLAAALAQVCAKQKMLPSNMIGRSSASVMEPDVEQMFQSQFVNDHFYKSYTCLKELLVSMDKRGDLYKLLYTTLTVVNIWDIGLNKAVYEILVLMASKCDNLLLVNVLDLKRDGKNLNQPLDLKNEKLYSGRYSDRKDDERLLRRHPAGDYFARFITACNSADNTTLLVGTHKDKFSAKELESTVFEVEHGVIDRAKGLGVSKCIHDEMIAVDATTAEGGKAVCRAVEDMIKHERRFLIDVPVSWIFLRCVLQVNGRFFMGRDEILPIALECGLKNKAEFEKWLCTFQKCSSIFYSSNKDLSSLHNNVILRPMEFVRCLDRLYYVEFDEKLTRKTSLKRHLQLLPNGLLTETLARELWPDEESDRSTQYSSQHERSTFLLNVLKDLKVSVAVPNTMCGKLLRGIECQSYFVPSLRQEVCTTPPIDHTHSLFILATGICTVQHQLQNQLIEYFHTRQDNIELIPGDQYNLLKFKWLAAKEKVATTPKSGKKKSASAVSEKPHETLADFSFYFMEDKAEVHLSVSPATKLPVNVTNQLCSVLKTACIEVFYNATQEVPRFVYSLAVACPNCGTERDSDVHYATFNPLVNAPQRDDCFLLTCSMCANGVVELKSNDPRSMWLTAAYQGSMRKVYVMKDSLSQAEIVDLEQDLCSLDRDSLHRLVDHLKLSSSEIAEVMKFSEEQNLALIVLLEWRRRHPVGNRRMLASALYNCGLNDVARKIDSTAPSPALRHRRTVIKTVPSPAVLGPQRTVTTSGGHDQKEQTTSVDGSDWAEICLCLKKMDRSNIQLLGGTLGLNMLTLEKMQDLPGDMVKAWLRQQDNVIEKCGHRLTWEALVWALQRIGQPAIADDILREKCRYDSGQISLITEQKPMTSSLATKPSYVINPIQTNELVMIAHSQASSSWEDLGVMLNVPSTDIQAIKEQYRGHADCCMEVLSHWLHHRVAIATIDNGREELSRALKKLGHHNLSDKILIGTRSEDVSLLK